MTASDSWIRATSRCLDMKRAQRAANVVMLCRRRLLQTHEAHSILYLLLAVTKSVREIEC